MMVGGTKEIFMSSSDELSGDIVGKLSVLLTESDDESELSNEGFVREEKLEEIMQELYREITTSSHNTPPSTVTMTSPPSPLPFLTVTEVKSESCGVSVSDSASSVMAGIEFTSPPAEKFDNDGNVGLPATGNAMDIIDINTTNNAIEGRGSVVVEGYGEDQKMNGYGEGEFEVGDDQWLARVLKWGPLELEEWT